MEGLPRTPLLWAGTALGGVAVVAVAVVLLVTFLGDEDEHIVLPPTEVGSCDSGVAVPDPAANAELVGDCESLLKAKDRLAGTATLNWSAGRPMTEWTGITTAGAPLRVTKLSLEEGGLTGELSGLLGNLTGLAELRLNANTLTGMVPSKLQQMTALTHLYLAGNPLTGCVPVSLGAVRSNDLSALSLPDCTPPRAVHEQRNLLDLEGGQTVTYQLYEKAPALTVDLPEGYTYKIRPITGEPNRPGIPSRTIMVLIYDAEGKKSWVSFDPNTGEEFYRYIHGEGGRTQDGQRIGAPAEPPDTPSPLNEAFDRISESAWLQE